MESQVTPFVQILYRSVARHEDFHPSDLDILRTAIKFNAAHGVTGILLRIDEQFFQALHGPVRDIEALMARIADDERHQNMEILLREEALDISPFTDWSMSYDSILGFEQELGLQEDGTYPLISTDRARALIALFAKTATSVATYGSAFPFARLSGENDAAYLERLDGLA
ncbi:BLUF domain-containing protein [Celeribacter sp. PS-C1]|uniref:BLUF domain-containing protein n=1 Tax=Celeribacter sp. PS-C1 TaxID=2820813 RepID=UPI001C6651DA|nr:BLUF domain-containing protein [Celeribacter sp. PS-C1]MBW6418617.1 BLUF domain-containing protein [Celeribacter sp. PS-C1]